MIDWQRRCMNRKSKGLDVEEGLIRGWMNGVKEVLSKRGLNIQKAKECFQNKREWRSVCWGERHDVDEPPV